jgi:TrmH family RNA methyltransferase
MSGGEIIDSIKHPQIALARALTTRGGREREGRGLADGMRLVTQILESKGPIDAVLVPVGTTDAALHAAAAAADVEVYQVKAGVLRHAIATTGTPDALAICRLATVEDDTTPAGRLAIVCDQVLDPGNLGSIIRTAVALGAGGVVLTGEEDTGARRVIDASRGAVLEARLHRFAGPKAAIEALQAAGWYVVAADAAAPGDLDALEYRGSRLALVVGNETHGVSPAGLRASDGRGAIGLSGPVESLNVAVAAGIGLWILNQRLAAGANPASDAAHG